MWMYLESNLAGALWATNVEAEDVEAKVVLPLHRLFHGVEFGSLVNVVPTVDAAHVEGSHETNDILSVLGHLPSGDLRRIKVRRVVLIQHFAFPHSGVVVVTLTTAN